MRPYTAAYIHGDYVSYARTHTDVSYMYKVVLLLPYMSSPILNLGYYTNVYMYMYVYKVIG